MLGSKVSRILTSNVGDFGRYSKINILTIDPGSI